MANLRANNLYGISGPDTNGSALFNGTDYLSAANAAAFRVNQGSTEDFTIEAWIYLTATPDGANARIASIYHTSGNQRSYMFYIHTDDQLKFNYASSGTAGSVSTLAGGTVPHNEWVHVAIAHEVSSTTLRLFKNGIEVATDNSPHTTYYANTSGDFTTGEDFTGNISNLHITLGTCKYTGNFTPYKEPIEEDSNTTVLCLNNRFNPLSDDKSNTFTQTSDGAVEASSFIPFDRADSGNVFDGPIKHNTQGYMYFPTGRTEERGRGRGIIAGGCTPLTSSIDYFNIQSQGNSIKFGNLQSGAIFANQMCSSSTRGISGGGAQPTIRDFLDYITIATESDSIDFGNLFASRRDIGALSNETRGIWTGGSTPSKSDVIDFVTIATLGNAQDFGNLTVATNGVSSTSSTTRGIISGGTDPSATVNTIEFITIASTGDASNFGDLTRTASSLGAVSNGTRAVFANGGTNTIDFITIASTGDATDFGDSTLLRAQCTATMSNGIRGVFAGGYQPSPNSTDTNTVDFIEIATTGNATDFGDISRDTNDSNRENGGCSDSHGGLSE